jgi:hypothetical protein
MLSICLSVVVLAAVGMQTLVLLVEVALVALSRGQALLVRRPTR